MQIELVGAPGTSDTLPNLTTGTAYRAKASRFDEDAVPICGSIPEATATLALLPPLTNFSISPVPKIGHGADTALMVIWDAALDAGPLLAGGGLRPHCECGFELAMDIARLEDPWSVSSGPAPRKGQPLGKDGFGGRGTGAVGVAGGQTGM